MSVDGVERKSSSSTIFDEVDESYFSPDVPLSDPITGSIVLAPPSIPAYLEQSLKPSRTIDIDLEGKVVQIKQVFAADAGRAEEPQILKVNGLAQDRVEDEDGLQELVGKISELVGPHRLEAVSEITSQRPGIALRNAIKAEFQRKFKYDPIFDARSVMDSSVDLQADGEHCQSETHLTGLIRMVMPRNDEDALEPLTLAHPIVYDATAEFDVVHQTIEYRISFHSEGPPKMRKFCTIL